MDNARIFSSPWVRAAVFLWGIVFPIVFVALPALKMATGETALNWAPFWAFCVWILSPLAISIAMKYRHRDVLDER